MGEVARSSMAMNRARARQRWPMRPTRTDRRGRDPNGDRRVRGSKGPGASCRDQALVVQAAGSGGRRTARGGFVQTRRRARAAPRSAQITIDAAAARRRGQLEPSRTERRRGTGSRSASARWPARGVRWRSACPLAPPGADSSSSRTMHLDRLRAWYPRGDDRDQDEQNVVNDATRRADERADPEPSR